MRIRPVRRDDATALQWRCWPDMSQFDVETRLIDVISRGERGLAWGVVAVDENDTPIAYGVLARWGRRSEIGDLVVNEDWRGHGIGSALIEHLLEQACALNLHEVEIGAALSNPRALALYRRLGFVETRRIHLDLGSGPEPVVFLTMENVCERAALGRSGD